ncbi:hypothetical protein J1N35_028886 [Gossypium stocksii]|uniref:Reverse transcriptase n=1 Tax=Gossypium stocksii TaxID=47602 RepID=A0A9D3UXR4_9ROSI|nr:hypothetical protein J1N35_028886 [Gossypium stocksii]
MAVKLDMSKAYDKVEWNFVEEVMIKMGFTKDWVDLIMSERLSALMRLAKKKGLIKGAKASRKGPEISHLLFVDDCVLFGEATDKGVRVLKDILKEYKVCSGQCVNFDKSTVYFSSNTTEDKKESVSTLLGVRRSSNLEKYLRLPNMVGRQKKESFQNLLDRVSTRIDRWSTRFLSQGGKEIFIKSVLQAILAYAMSCFLLPNFLCEKLESIFARFWWQKGNKGSYVWRSIWATKGTLEKGLIWKVGTGENISVLNNVWIPDYDKLKLSSGGNYAHVNTVADLINPISRTWRRELIVNTFPETEAELIIRIPLAIEAHTDYLAWNANPSGEFTVKSAYRLLQHLDPTAYALQTDYKNYLPTRVNLIHRNLRNNPLCPRCGVTAETTNHLFRECSVSKTVWKALAMETITLYASMEIGQWLTKGVKINFDAAFNDKTHLSASGVVVRDSRGIVLLSSSEIHRGVASAFAEEAIACRRATQVSIDMQNPDTTIEGDSLSVIRKCNDDKMDKSRIGAYIYYIQKMKSAARQLRFVHVTRSANTLAHILATESLKREEEVYLVGGILDFAKHQVRNESVREPD